MSGQPGDRLAAAMVRAVYSDLSALSKGIEDNLQVLQRLATLLEEVEESETGSQLTQVVRAVAEGEQNNLAYVATIQDRIRQYGLAPE